MSTETETGREYFARVARSPDLESYVGLLQLQYGEDLRGLSLAELAQLPDVDWVPEDAASPAGAGDAGHPSERGFSFDVCPDFFDGRSYVAALTARFGPDLADMPAEIAAALPHLQYPSLPQYHVKTPAQVTDELRKSHVILSRPWKSFEA